MNKYLLLILLLLTACQSNLEREHSSELKMNFIIVDRIINNADLLITVLDSNFAVSDYNKDLNYYFGFLDELRLYIANNKFADGYKIEKDTIQQWNEIINFKVSLENIFLTHKIKVRSETTGNVIWFTFTNKFGLNKKGGWKFMTYSLCNNPEFKFSDSEPCDKN
jgi:hypothetical protein